jgi:uncharacterized protein DUF3667
MTDVVTADPPGADSARCANCGAALHGPFCADCGQADKPLDPPVRHFISEFTQELFDVDSRALRSFRRLLFSPGFLTREHVEGRRVPWLSPLKLYLLASVAAFAVLAFAGDDAGLKIAVTPSAQVEAVDPSWTQQLGYATPEDLAAAISAARAVWIPRVMFVLVPLFAWLISRVRRGAGRHYPSHLVFALHVHAATFAMRGAMTALSLAMPASTSRWLDAVVSVYAIGYAYLALRSVYGGTRLRAVRDLILVGTLYWAALVAGAAAAVLSAVTGRAWLAWVGL